MHKSPGGRTALECARSGGYSHTVLTMEEAAQYIGGFEGERRADSCRKFLQARGVRLLQVGRHYRVRVGAIDALLETGKGDLDRSAEQRIADFHQGKR